ncbi:uncharacterized protein sb:cb288 isoform X2 [Boleophthalmus pectinirostris]|uniref:uncharacterized protein sb:cb288 isoform X2 n=1 Tax=Boleophthalmus pectinirostris TaxID=150288 RepID=UPI0024317E0F|nr:uncharacterized protein sb:cb288 isoform X2 [Boleophthalmus pectinirostris]
MEVMDHRVNSVPNVSKVVDPDLAWKSFNPVHPRNGSTAAATHLTLTEDSERSGIVPALVAAALFITLLLTLYAVLWKCMDSKVPQRKKSKVRVRVRQTDTV